MKHLIRCFDSRSSGSASISSLLSLVRRASDDHRPHNTFTSSACVCSQSGLNLMSVVMSFKP